MTTSHGTKKSLPDGASFTLITNSGFRGRTFTSKFYLYSPSHPTTPMLNSAVFVYPDKPYTGKAQAWQELVDTGLLGLAEKESIYIVMPLPVNGETWSEDDLKTFYDAQYYLAGGDSIIPLRPSMPKVEYNRLLFSNMQYIIAEGDGATFVNNNISQQAGHIAGILTFGGKIDPSIKVGVAVPVYLVNADKAAVAFYKMINGTDTGEQPGVFVNSKYPLKKVITAKGGSNFDTGFIADAWIRIFRRTSRICITDNVFLNIKNTGEWVLMDRPIYKELGITRFDHKDEKLPDGRKASWYDYVPDIVLANPKKKVPLLIALHGGGDAADYHMDSSGLTIEAADKQFIVIAPETWGINEAGENLILNILERTRNIYPVDEKRIYVSGFSGGGSSTAFFGLRNPEKFAAIAVMGSSGYPNDVKFRDIVDIDKNKINLPFTMIIGTNDPQFAADENGHMCLPAVSQLGNDPANQRLKGAMLPLGGRDGLRQLLKLNNVDPGSPDYEKYPYWGFPVEDTETVVDKDMRYHVGYMKKGGQAFAKFVLFENAGHANSETFASLAWNFMSRFSR